MDCLYKFGGPLFGFVYSYEVGLGLVYEVRRHRRFRGWYMAVSTSWGSFKGVGWGSFWVDVRQAYSCYVI